MLSTPNRLTKKEDFESVRQNGKFFTTPLFSLSFKDRKDGLPSRFGFIVSKKISTKANVRNKIKRTLRELIQENLNEIKEALDVVIVAKPGIIHATHDTIVDSFRNFLSESGLKIHV